MPQPVYSDHEPTQCPKCRSRKIYSDEIELLDGNVSVRVFCEECNANWCEVYRFSHYFVTEEE